MKILTVDYKGADSPALFFKSLRETGFGVVKNHPISTQLITEVFGAWKAFFASNEKMDYLFDRSAKGGQDGYFPPEVAEKAKGAEVLDLKEFYQYYISGRCPEALKAKTRELRDQMLEMGEVLLHWIDDHLPEDAAQHLSMPVSTMADHKDSTQLRILHYPPLPEPIPEGAIRAAAHEDINLITLLVSATAPGLQAMHASGKWFDVPCDPNAIIVNVGDMLQEATGHYLTATKHRVVNPLGDAAKASRYSIPLFIHPRADVRLSDKYTAGEYLRERLTELGLLD